MNHVLAALRTSGEVVLPDGSREPLHSHLPELECAVLDAWIKNAKPSRLLEIGMAFGVSALAIFDAVNLDQLCDYQIIDPYQMTQWKGGGVRHLDAAGFDGRYTLHLELSELCLPRLLGARTTFDFVFIDGFHTFDHAMLDFFYVNRMLAIGGIVVFDDLQCPSIERVAAFVDSLPAYRRLELPAAIAGDRTVRIRRMAGQHPVRVVGFEKIAADTRPWNWHESF